jgi:MarR family transcriptional regulator, 2-MHQ and catechol-resistance regulon repressor
MTPKPSSPAQQPSLVTQVTEPADQPYIDAARALLRASFLFGNDPERPFNAYGLSLAQVDVLGTLARAENASLNCSEIAERTLITKGGITGILDRLEARGLVKRVPSQDDRRSVLIRLSTKGVDFCRKFYPELARSGRQTFEKAFRPEQMREFSKLLAQLVRSLETEYQKNMNAGIGVFG